MNLIYLYDEFMRVSDHTEGQAVYIIDPEIQEGYEISDKVLMYRYQLAEQAGAEIYQGKTLDILAEIHQKNPYLYDHYQVNVSPNLPGPFSRNQAKS